MGVQMMRLSFGIFNRLPRWLHKRRTSSSQAIIEFDFTKAHRKEAWLFLDTVWQGLEYLCQQVERVERERAKPDKNFAYLDFGSSPGDADGLQLLPLVCERFV
jgi:hypothetical protein